MDNQPEGTIPATRDTPQGNHLMRRMRSRGDAPVPDVRVLRPELAGVLGWQVWMDRREPGGPEGTHRYMKRGVVLVIIFLAAGCAGPSPVQPTAPNSAPAPLPSGAAPSGALPSGSTTLSKRPLVVPSVAPGGECPTTAQRPWSGPGVATAVLGDGPVYPVADYFRSGTTLELGRDDRELDGSYSKKVRWIGAGYTGPVFIRIYRVDAPGTGLVRFSDWGVQRDGGYYADLPTPNTDLPAVTSVGGPGCYAYQVDGDTFSTAIVFRAVVV
jgi:hypothetical protein